MQTLRTASFYILAIAIISILPSPAHASRVASPDQLFAEQNELFGSSDPTDTIFREKGLPATLDKAFELNEIPSEFTTSQRDTISLIVIGEGEIDKNQGEIIAPVWDGPEKINRDSEENEHQIISIIREFIPDSVNASSLAEDPKIYLPSINN